MIETNAAEVRELLDAELAGIVGGAVRNSDIDLIRAEFALPKPSGFAYLLATGAGDGEAAWAGDPPFAVPLVDHCHRASVQGTSMAGWV